jgi:hypothetical protein
MGNAASSEKEINALMRQTECKTFRQYPGGKQFNLAQFLDMRFGDFVDVSRRLTLINLEISR